MKKLCGSVIGAPFDNSMHPFSIFTPVFFSFWKKTTKERLFIMVSSIVALNTLCSFLMCSCWIFLFPGWPGPFKAPYQTPFPLHVPMVHLFPPIFYNVFALLVISPQFFPALGGRHTPCSLTSSDILLILSPGLWCTADNVLLCLFRSKRGQSRMWMFAS